MKSGVEVFSTMLAGPDKDADRLERQVALHEMLWNAELSAVAALESIGWHPAEIMAELLTLAVTMAVEGLGEENARKMLHGCIDQGCDQCVQAAEEQATAAVKH